MLVLSGEKSSNLALLWWNSMVLLTFYLCLKIVGIFRTYLRFRKFPQKKESVLFGNLYSLDPDFPRMTGGFKILHMQSSFSDLLELGFFVGWVFWKPYVIITDNQAVHNVLTEKLNVNKGSEYKLFEAAWGQGLLTSNGDKWKYRRKALEPAFKAKVLQNFVPIMMKSAENLVRSVEELQSTKADLNELVSSVAVRIILKTALGLDENAYDSLEKAPKEYRKWARYIFQQIRNPLLWTKWMRSIYEALVGMDRTISYCKKIPKYVVDQKIQLEMTNQGEIKKEDDDQNENDLKQKTYIDVLFEKYLEDRNSTSPYKFDDSGLIEEVITIFAAGFDTSAATLVWTLYSIGCSEEIQEKLYAEVSKMDMEKISADINYLNNFPYLDQVVKEGLRIRPIVPIVQRKIQKDFRFKEFLVPKGTDVIIPIFYIHRDPRNYPNPDKFDPDRFSFERFKDLPRDAYIPFAAGPRQCIGKKFAFLELKIVISTLIRNFKITTEKPLDEVVFETDFVSFPKEPLNVEFKARHQ